MPTQTNMIPRDSDSNNANEAAYINTILGFSGGLAAASGRIAQSRAPFLFDHFFMGTMSTHWVGTATGTTGNDVPVAYLAGASGGAIKMTSGTGALEAQEVAGKDVGWIPSTMGPLRA